jgi:hypothetical protein
VRAVLALCLSLIAAACGDNIRGNITLAVPAAWEPVMSEFVELTPYIGMRLGTGGDFAIELVEDAAIPGEGFRIDKTGADRWTVRASDVLGAQYGAAAALENLGFRFRHPYSPYMPREPVDRGDPIGIVHQPDIRVRG